MLGGLASLFFCGAALSEDGSDDGSDKPKAAPRFPTTYVDLRTIYSTLPANSISVGFGSSLPLATIRQTVTSPSLQGAGVDVPVTIDLSDRISVYGGISTAATQAGTDSWTAVSMNSWNIGIQADIYRQEGGVIPTITVQETITRSTPDAPLATTSLNSLIEANYALNEDETRGVLAGFQYTKVAVDTPLASVNPNLVGYIGGYYQWDNNWKLTGRAGVQSFGGARLLNLDPLPSFTEPILLLDLDRLDDNDNRLFGVSLQIAWLPKPSYQLTLRTPLYLVRN
ncbi:hypothetical protein HAP47_0032835 [Bradyrhizobium sp. 41S5]|uniref:hypothetical protein n=1 Tax=Bradyrhizobium sp. 41S5 TaxID=1404443 RepID=UPI00156BCA0D|nr:hypothetical protein [Bradyrhizobium sp. 41S5]UFX43950.1 hypothetical protein HAP47_0032835 [Bradyrhizobium sp. 41S5]